MASADPRVLIPEIEKFEHELRDVYVKASTAVDDSAQVQSALEDLVASTRDQANRALYVASTAQSSANTAVAESRRARADSERAGNLADAAGNAAQAAIAESHSMQNHWQGETSHASAELSRAERELEAAQQELRRLLDIYHAALNAERAAGAALSSCLARQYTDSNGNRQGPSCSGEANDYARASAARHRAEEPLPAAHDRVAYCQDVVRQWMERLQHCQLRLGQARNAVEASVTAAARAQQARGIADESRSMASDAEASATTAMHAANAAMLAAENAAQAARAADQETSSARATTVACGQAVDEAQSHASIARTRLVDSVEALRRFDSAGVRA